MSEKELTIRIRGVNETKPATQEAITDLKRVETATKESEQAKVATATDAAKARTEAIKNASVTERASLKNVADELTSVGAKGKESFGAIAAAVLASNATIGKGIELAKAYSDAAEAALKKSRELASGFLSDRDALRDLASMMGVGPRDLSKFALENAAFNKQTAMRSDEGIAFRSGFQGSGAQFAGKSLSEAEFAQFEKQAASLTTARGLAPNVGGEFFGSILGMKDFSKHGEKASEEALGVGNAALAVLGRGRGDNSVLTNQLSMLAAGTVSDDALRGSLTDPVEAAAMVSTAAEKSPSRASELSLQALRGLRDFKNPLIQKAGINAGTSPLDAFARLAPIVDAEAKASGVKPEDVLREKFSDVGTAEAISVFLNKGVTGGLFKDRLDYAKGFGAESAGKTIEDFMGSEVGQSRVADASVREAQLKRGNETSKAETLRRQALARLIESKKIDTTQTNLTDYVVGRGSFGLLKSDDQTRINSEVEQLLSERADLAGVGERTVNNGLQVVRPASRHNSPEDFNRYVDERIGAIEGAGYSALTGRKDPQLGEVVRLLQEQNKLMRKDQPSDNPAALPAQPPGAMRR